MKPTAHTNGALPPATVPARRPPRKAKAMDPAPQQPATLMEAIIQASSDPTIDTGKVRELVDLHKTLQERDWERQFNAAMVACQTELQPVARNKDNTQTQSRYADLARLAEAALPIIHQHGFAITFSEAGTEKPNHIGVLVSVRHREGHTERFTFHVPVDLCGFKGTPNKTAIHGWGSALTYCRRYSLLCAFNVIVAGDDDGQAAGQKSSASLKREGVWADFERDMRGAASIAALEKVCNRWRGRIQFWSKGYREAAVELKGQQIERLGGTLAQLQESVEATDHDYERWARMRAEHGNHW